MIITIPYRTREDGVNLIKTFAGVYDAEGKANPTYYMIHKIGTGEYYDLAIDVESAPWSYEETDIPVEHKENIEIERDGISDTEFRRLVEEAL